MAKSLKTKITVSPVIQTISGNHIWDSKPLEECDRKCYLVEFCWMRSRTGGNAGPCLCSTCVPHALSRCDTLDTCLVTATGSLGSLDLHSKHLENFIQTQREGGVISQKLKTLLTKSLKRFNHRWQLKVCLQRETWFKQSAVQIICCSNNLLCKWWFRNSGAGETRLKKLWKKLWNYKKCYFNKDIQKSLSDHITTFCCEKKKIQMQKRHSSRN